MDEEGPPNELLALTNEIRILKKTLAAVEAADKTSVSCRALLNTIKDAEGSDPFLILDEPKEANKFHTNVAGSGSDGGCCTVV